MGISGIYCIRHNVEGGRVYVGSAANVRSRWSKHAGDLNRGRHYNKLLQASWAKYGAGAFVFEALEWLEDKICLAAREQHWMDTLGAFGPKGFNLLPNARTPFGRKHSAETKAKIGAAHKGRKRSEEWNRNNAEVHRGIRPSPEAIAKGAAARTGLKRSAEASAKAAASNRGQKRSPEALAKMSAWQQGREPSEAQKAMRKSLATIWVGRTHTPETKAKMRQKAIEREAAKRAAHADTNAAMNIQLAGTRPASRGRLPSLKREEKTFERVA